MAFASPSRMMGCLPVDEILSEFKKVLLPFSKISDTQDISTKDFPKDFMFGCSTSALQTEGSANEGGRGPSTWDDFIGPDQRAIHSYKRYEEDVKLLEYMGANCYRFSISWSRLLPEGTISGGINQEGIDFYNNLINELKSKKITPIVTLFHFDLPTALQNKYNGFLDSQIVEDFKAYAILCFKTFGDRVKYWITINEPQVFAEDGYKEKLSIPDVVTNPYTAGHNIILAHAIAAKHYKKNYQPTQKGEIGISLVTEWFEAKSDTKPDTEASERAFDFKTGWMLEPLVFGHYPFSMKALVRDNLPKFTDDQKTLIEGSYDFIGVNYYTSRYASAVPLTLDEKYTTLDQYQHVKLSVKKDGEPIGEEAPGEKGVYVYPPGLGKALVYISKFYNNPKIHITENGYPEKRDDSIPRETALHDDARIKHITEHLKSVKEAIKSGANVKGYCMWSLMDCLEMGSNIEKGYDVRYGLCYTDYSELKRYPKHSSHWLKKFMTPE